MQSLLGQPYKHTLLDLIDCYNNPNIRALFVSADPLSQLNQHQGLIKIP
ncbi:hypothetical protein ABIB50_001843 [Mucilaginibacter sp. UYCu711]